MGRGKIPLKKTGGIALQIPLPFRSFCKGCFFGPERDIRFVFVGIGPEQNGVGAFPLHAYGIPGKTRIEMRQVFPTDNKMEHRSVRFDIPGIQRFHSPKVIDMIGRQ